MYAITLPAHLAILATKTLKLLVRAAAAVKTRAEPPRTSYF